MKHVYLLLLVLGLATNMHELYAVNAYVVPYNISINEHGNIEVKLLLHKNQTGKWTGFECYSNNFSKNYNGRAVFSETERIAKLIGGLYDDQKDLETYINNNLKDFPLVPSTNIAFIRVPYPTNADTTDTLEWIDQDEMRAREDDINAQFFSEITSYKIGSITPEIIFLTFDQAQHNFYFKTHQNSTIAHPIIDMQDPHQIANDLASVLDQVDINKLVWTWIPMRTKDVILLGYDNNELKKIVQAPLIPISSTILYNLVDSFSSSAGAMSNPITIPLFQALSSPEGKAFIKQIDPSVAPTPEPEPAAPEHPEPANTNNQTITQKLQDALTELARALERLTLPLQKPAPQNVDLSDIFRKNKKGYNN